MEHLGRTIVATMAAAVLMALRRRYGTHLAMAAWMEYANLVMVRTTYVGTGTTGHRKQKYKKVEQIPYKGTAKGHHFSGKGATILWCRVAQ